MSWCQRWTAISCAIYWNVTPRHPTSRSWCSLHVSLKKTKWRVESAARMTISRNHLISRILKMHIQNLLKWRPVGMTGKLEPQIRQEQITSLDEKLVQDATQFVEQNISESDLTVVSLSEALNMSRVNLYRKLLSVTGKTPSEFIRLIRLRHAEQLLMKSQLSISEISYRVGFSSQRYFSKCYKDLYGYMPSQYKRNKEPIK